jgi:hypothetical protein
MEIIKRVKAEWKFKVIKPFMLAGRVLKKGEEVNLSESDQTPMVTNGRVIPADLPEVAVYIALRPFSLPGSAEKHTAEKMDLVSLKREDALSLMLAGVVIPRNPSTWRPNNRRLRTGATLKR